MCGNSRTLVLKKSDSAHTFGETPLPSDLSALPPPKLRAREFGFAGLSECAHRGDFLPEAPSPDSPMTQLTWMCDLGMCSVFFWGFPPQTKWLLSCWVSFKTTKQWGALKRRQTPKMAGVFTLASFELKRGPSLKKNPGTTLCPALAIPSARCWHLVGTRVTDFTTDQGDKA